MTKKHIIPNGVMTALELAPKDRPVSMLIRHSVRGPIPEGEHGNDVLLTDEGIQLANELGRLCGGRLTSISTSPVQRCVQTVEALREGAKVDLEIAKSTVLGHPGAMVDDSKLSWDSHLSIGAVQIWKMLAAGETNIPGIRSAGECTRLVIEHMEQVADGHPGLHLFVSHDNLVVTTACHLLGIQLDDGLLPDFLEATTIWQEDEKMHLVYKGKSGDCDWLEPPVLDARPLGALTPD